MTPSDGNSLPCHTGECGLGFVVSPLGCGQGLHCFDSSSVGSHSIGLVFIRQPICPSHSHCCAQPPVQAPTARAAGKGGPSEVCKPAEATLEIFANQTLPFFLRLRRSLPERHLPISGLKGRGRGLGDKGGERAGVWSNVQGLGLMFRA